MKFDPVTTPDNLRANHSRNGGRDLSQWRADVDSGFLRVMIAREPVPELRWHISVSVGPEEGPAIRAATDDEMKEVYRRFPVGKMIEDNEGTEPGSLVRHLWEE